MHTEHNFSLLITEATNDSTGDSSWRQWNCFQGNVGTAYERETRWCACGLSGAVGTILNSMELNRVEWMSVNLWRNDRVTYPWTIYPVTAFLCNVHVQREGGEEVTWYIVHSEKAPLLCTWMGFFMGDQNSSVCVSTIFDGSQTRRCAEGSRFLSLSFSSFSSSFFSLFSLKKSKL